MQVASAVFITADEKEYECASWLKPPRGEGRDGPTTAWTGEDWLRRTGAKARAQAPDLGTSTWASSPSPPASASPSASPSPSPSRVGRRRLWDYELFTLAAVVILRSEQDGLSVCLTRHLIFGSSGAKG